MNYFGDFNNGDIVYIPFNTFDSDGASVTVTDLANTDIHVHKNGAVAQQSVNASESVDINFDTITGNHLVAIDTGGSADASFYVAGNDYQVRLEGITIDGQTLNSWIGSFSIENRFMRGTDSANTTVPDAAGVAPTAVEIRTEIDSNSTRLDANISSRAPSGEYDTELDVNMSTRAPASEYDTEMARITGNVALASVVGALNDAASAGDPTNADTVVQYLKQLVNTLEGAVGIPTYPAEAAPGNNVSLAETIRAIHADVTGLNGDVMVGTNGANTTVPDAAGVAPTAIENRQEMDSNSTRLDANISSRAPSGEYDTELDANMSTRAPANEYDTEMARITGNVALASVVGALNDVASAGDPTNADTVVQYLKQLVNTLEGAVGIPTYPAEAAPGNNVSLAEAIRAIHADVTGLNGDVMVGTNGANTTVPDAAGVAPTAVEIRTEIDSNSTRLSAIETDTNEVQGKLPTNEIMGSSDKTDKDDEIDAIKVVTDILNGMITEDSAGDNFNTAALANAPSGSGGDATQAKQDTIIAAIGSPANIDTGGATIADNLKKIADDNGGADFDATNHSLEALRIRGDAAWVTGGGGAISEILRVNYSIPKSIDLANTATVRIAIILGNAVDDLPSTAQITPGTISIERKAFGGTSWVAVVTDGAMSEAAGHIYYDEVFDSGTGYAAGDSIRITFKSQKITAAANDYEIHDGTGVMFQTSIRASISQAQDVVDALMADTGFTAGGTMTYETLMKLNAAWIAGNWRDKSGSTTIKELLDPDDSSVILEMTLSETTPQRQITVS